MKKNWIDRLIEFGAGCDWITPSLSLLSGDTTVIVPEDAMGDVDFILCQGGIKQKRRTVRNGEYMFDVRPEDAEAVKRLLWGES